MRANNWVSVVGACLAVLSLTAAFYFFSLGVLFDAGCHMGNEAACANLRMTLALSFVLGLLAVVIAGATIGQALARTRRRHTRNVH